MEQNEKILKYLADYMQPDEKLDFEKELEKSDALKQKLREYSDSLKLLKDIPLEENQYYFSNLLPKVMYKISGRHRIPLIPKLAAGVAFVVILFLVFKPFGTHDKSVEQLLSNSSDAYQNEILASIEEPGTSTLSSEELAKTEEFISTKISTELKLTELTKETDYAKTSYLLENINEAEANEIYNELVNKKIL